LVPHATAVGFVFADCHRAGRDRIQPLYWVPLSILGGKDRVDDRQQGCVHLGIGAATLAGAGLLTWLAYQFQINWLGGSSHWMTAGAFVVGVYELFYGADILLFRTGVLGVLMLMYGFVYGALHLIVFR
jgi:hypothetical protein